MTNHEKARAGIKLNEKGRCPFCKIKPLLYKRQNKFWCHRCGRDFNLVTGIFEENNCWTANNKCKHPGRPKASRCPNCGKWENITN